MTSENERRLSSDVEEDGENIAMPFSPYKMASPTVQPERHTEGDAELSQRLTKGATTIEHGGRCDSGICVSICDSGIGSMPFDENNYSSECMSVPLPREKLPSLSETQCELGHLTLNDKSDTDSLLCEEASQFPVECPVVAERLPTKAPPCPVECIQEDDSDVHPLFKQDEEGDTQLHIAIIQLLGTIITQLVKFARQSSDIDIQNDLRQTPLHLAVLTRQPQVVRTLLAAGASPDSRDRKGNTPLHLACRVGDLACVRELTRPLVWGEYRDLDLSYQIPCHTIPQDLTTKNFEGLTCLHIAAAGSHTDIIQHLLSIAGPDYVNIQDATSGRTILHHAVESRNMSLLEWVLLYTNVDLEATTFGSFTALKLAKGRGYVDVYTTLVMADADVTTIGSDSDETDDEEDMANDSQLDDLEICGLSLNSL